MWENENLKNIEIDDPIKLGFGNPNEWKSKYYCHYFGDNSSDTITKVCKEYIDGLKWIGKYYFDKCTSWNWQYKYTHAPFISDLYEYIKNNKNIENVENSVSPGVPRAPLKEPLSLNGDFNDKNIIITPFIQLLITIPVSYCNLLPASYSKLITDDNSPIKDLFPREIKTDMINKTYKWQCIPLLPLIDVEYLTNVDIPIKTGNINDKKTCKIKELKLTKSEEKRNKIETQNIIIN